MPGMRRTIDIVISAGCLTILSPVMLLLAIITEGLTPGAFVRQNGRLKFRPVHPALQRFSLDELPALIDILLGQRSFSDSEIRELFLASRNQNRSSF